MNILKLNRILPFSLTLIVLSIAVFFISCEKEIPIDNTQNEFTIEDAVSHKFNLKELTKKVSNDENFIKVQDYNHKIAQSIETIDDISKITPMPAEQLENYATQLLKNIPELNDLDINSLSEVFIIASNSNIAQKNCSGPYICCINALVAAYNACLGEGSSRKMSGQYNNNEYTAFINACAFSYNFGRGRCPR